MLDRLPQTEPKRTLSIFGIVGALSVVVIVPLALSDGDDGVRDAIEEANEQTSRPTTATPAPPATTPPPTTTPPPPTTPLPPEPPKRPPRELRVGQTGTDDRLELTVRSLERARRVDASRFFPGTIKAPPGGSLVVAEVSYVNRTRAVVDPFCGGNSAALIDRDGRSHDTVPTLYKVTGNDAICGSAGTPAGHKATVKLVFKLEKGRRPSHLDLWNGKFRPDFDGESSRLRFRP